MTALDLLEETAFRDESLCVGSHERGDSPLTIQRADLGTADCKRNTGRIALVPEVMRAQ
jgi:hypothetical protein